MLPVTINISASCKPNPGRGSWGIVLRFGKATREIHGEHQHSTNNRAILTAAIEALKALKQPCDVALHTNSTYLKDGISGKNEQRKNIGKWVKLQSLCKKHKVSWRWLREYSGSKDMTRAKHLAQTARKEENRTCTTGK